MSRLNLEGSEIRDSTFFGGNRWKSMTQTLAGTFTISASHPHVLVLDPDAVTRTVLLPAEADGLFFMIANAETASGDLTVKEDAGVTTIATIGPGDVQLFVCNGTTWFANSIDTAAITTLTVPASLAHGEDGTDLLGFYGATPVDQPASVVTVDSTTITTVDTTTITTVDTTTITTVDSTTITTVDTTIATTGLTAEDTLDDIIEAQALAINRLIADSRANAVAINRLITDAQLNAETTNKLVTDAQLSGETVNKVVADSRAQAVAVDSMITHLRELGLIASP